VDLPFPDIKAYSGKGRHFPEKHAHFIDFQHYGSEVIGCHLVILLPKKQMNRSPTLSGSRGKGGECFCVVQYRQMDSFVSDFYTGVNESVVIDPATKARLESAARIRLEKPSMIKSIPIVLSLVGLGWEWAWWSKPRVRMTSLNRELNNVLICLIS
jgi:hypothetical protein